MTAQLDQNSYYPSAKVSLDVRFEEFGDKKVANAGRAANPKASIKLKGTKAADPPLVPGKDPNAPVGISRILLNPKTGSKVSPQDQTSSADGYSHPVGGILPRKATWSVNGPRTADTLSVTIRWIDLPVDPRTVRSCAIVFYLGTVTADSFVAGINGKNRGSGPGEPMHLISEKYIDEAGQERTNKRFEGYVDKWSVEMGTDEPVVVLECRDNTSSFIDTDAPQNLVIDMSKPIDAAVAQYLANFPQFAGLFVEYRPSAESPPVMKDVFSKTATKGKLGPQASKGGGAASGGGAAAKLSVWDYLTDVCGTIGLMVRLEDHTVIIQHVRSYMTASYAKKAGEALSNSRPDDPFKSRVLAGGETIYARRMIYGRNLLTYKTSRSFATVAPVNIEIRCYVPARKTTMIAHFPKTAGPKGNAAAPGTDTLTAHKPGDTPPEEKWEVHRVSGIKDQATLDRVAQAYYEQHARRELEVVLKTENLASFGGGNTDPDLLDMKAGDSIEVLVSRGKDEINSMSKIETTLLMQAECQAFMKHLGHGPKFAAAYAKAYADAGFQTIYRVKNFTANWGVEEGVSFDINCFNYLEVRMDIPAQGGK